MSVHFHILSPHSKGLFHGAISESGSALMPLFFRQHGVLSQAQRLAEAVGCPTENSKELVSCLRKVDVETIMRNQPSDVSTACLLELCALIRVTLVLRVTPLTSDLPECCQHPMYNSPHENINPFIVGREVTKKNSAPCASVINQSFGGTCRLHL
jgi:hypothetical protein